MTKLFGQVLAQTEDKGLISDEYFSVDGTMIEAGLQEELSAERCTRPLQPHRGLPNKCFHTRRGPAQSLPLPHREDATLATPR